MDMVIEVFMIVLQYRRESGIQDEERVM